MAAIVAAYRLQADKDNAQLRMKEDEIELLRNAAFCTVQNAQRRERRCQTQRIGRTAGLCDRRLDGKRALNVLPPVALRELPSTQARCCTGIEDAFRGQLRLGEQERNKALFDVSQQVFQNLNKIEQKTSVPARNISRRLQRKKMWSLKRASTAASITRVKEK